MRIATSVTLKFLTTIFVLTSALDGHALTCQSLFAPLKKSWSLEESLELLRKADPQNADLYFDRLNWISRFNLRKLKTKIRPEVLRKTKSYDQAALLIESTIKRDLFVRNLLQGKWYRAKEGAAIKAAYHKILTVGLLNTIEESPLPHHQLRRRDQLMIIVRRLVDTPVIKQILWIPGLYFRLPAVNSAEIPNELLSKMIVDGPEAHKAELEAWYRSTSWYKFDQRKRDVYRSIDTGYRVIVWAISLWMLPHTLEKVDAGVNRAVETYESYQSKRALEVLTDEAETLEAGTDQLDAELKRRGI